MSEFAAELPSMDEFRKAVDMQFEATTSKGVPLTLTLTALETHVDDDTQENFSLYFSSSDRAAPSQDTFTLRNDSLGEIVLFLVPVGRDANGLHFEAVFNRFKK